MNGSSFSRRRITTDTFFVLALFAVFTVSVLFVLLSGAGVYRDSVAEMDKAYGERTAQSYLVSKLRHSDAAGSDGANLVKAEVINGSEVLELYEEYMGVSSVTYIYCADGWLCELYTGADSGFDPSLGEHILEADSFSVKIDGSVVRLNVDGASFGVTLRAGE